jgi:putative colanic acid biosynthesis acetyltransferase WcaF
LKLNIYNNTGFTRGRSLAVEIVWQLVQAFLVGSVLPGSWHRKVLLRLFGAQIGAHVVVKPGLRVKFPWRLQVGDWAWLGEDVWIDNLADVAIGSHAVVSQGAYLCTGSHDWSRESFDLIVRPIVVQSKAWVCASAVLAPGTDVGEGAVVGLGAVASGVLKDWTIYRGNPAIAAGARTIVSSGP